MSGGNGNGLHGGDDVADENDDLTFSVSLQQTQEQQQQQQQPQQQRQQAPDRPSSPLYQRALSMPADNVSLVFWAKPKEGDEQRGAQDATDGLSAAASGGAAGGGAAADGYTAASGGGTAAADAEESLMVTWAHPHRDLMSNPTCSLDEAFDAILMASPDNQPGRDGDQNNYMESPTSHTPPAATASPRAAQSPRAALSPGAFASSPRGGGGGAAAAAGERSPRGPGGGAGGLKGLRARSRAFVSRVITKLHVIGGSGGSGGGSGSGVRIQDLRSVGSEPAPRRASESHRHHHHGSHRAQQQSVEEGEGDEDEECGEEPGEMPVVTQQRASPRTLPAPGRFGKHLRSSPTV
eukprot:TRINITY_DN6222_c2_g1_i3.p1 TRINITY_DN6222_c2_g1~~TRINITY_DN6222_c2_g1_i3.p1  ORF type:complete len:368 (-),score=8.39 TRINITY_DN6222_c2_g1_i3:185-1237(-)